MDDPLPQRFFREPACAQQRRYEALRAVFVEGLSQKEAARRFGYSHGGFRLLVQQFRAACAAGAPPPFSPSHPGDGRRPTRRGVRRPSRTSQRSPTPGR
jgi:transposase